MITFSHLWVLLLLPLPFVVRSLLPAHRERSVALYTPWFTRLLEFSGRKSSRGASTARRSAVRAVSVALTWSFVVIALAKPQWVGPPIHKQIPTRDLMLIVDLSGSMETEDFQNADGKKISRLDAVKEVVGDFLVRRKGDRVGLIVFGNAPFVQVPFTQDLEASRILLEETAVRMAGPKTALGDSIGLAIRTFEESKVEQRVIIALTDGNDTGSQIPPAKAAAIAADEGITIHTVAVGDPEAAGEEKLDEAALKEMARITGGQFFHASDREELAGIYTELDRIETRNVETLSHRPRRDLYHWALGMAFALSVVTLAASRAIAHRRKESAS